MGVAGGGVPAPGAGRSDGGGRGMSPMSRGPGRGVGEAGEGVPKVWGLEKSLCKAYKR